ncbi:MAG: glycyl-radical enzyme activating protein [Clostridiales bacterium]|nr:glycyl-radical enzyme activating protein [Clostridiales bacterium]
MKACISNIQKFSVDDGPGIRTTVFFKGCNLRCAWCHNPECISPVSVLQFTKSACTCCGRCAAVCPAGVHSIGADGHLIRREACLGCGACEKACHSQALKQNGLFYSPEEIMDIILKDREFYIDSGGGATFSGGEPMLQHEFLKQLLFLCRDNQISTAIDTAGNVPYEWYEELLSLTDYFLYDIKLATPALHQQYTGVDNTQILANIRKLSEAGANLIVRVPVIPGVNDATEELEKIANILTEISPQLVQLLPYHSYGTGKYESFGLKNPLGVLTPPSREFMEQALQMFLRNGLRTSF